MTAPFKLSEPQNSSISSTPEVAHSIVPSDVKEYFYKQTRTIEECLVWCSEHDCSDLYVKVYERPFISRYGKIIELPCTPISKDIWARFYDIYVLNELNAKYVREKLLDISVEVRIPDTSTHYGKYDTNFYKYRASFGFSGDRNIATFRMIKPKKPTFDTINYPSQCKDALTEALKERRGIVLFTGPTGSGKALRKDTFIPTPQGMTTLGLLDKGSKVLAEDGTVTKILDMYQPECNTFYRLEFDNRVSVNAAGNHLWKVMIGHKYEMLLTTDDLVIYWNSKVPITIYRPESKNPRIRFDEHTFVLTGLVMLEDEKAEDYVCIKVSHPSHLFLCTPSYIPTHNSTTLAACINTFTQAGGIMDNKVIITLEDPIENMFSNTESVKIVQKELDRDFRAFATGIKAALREHPNIIIVGECRDKEVICTALEASQTGHVVLTSFHAGDVAGTVSRLLYHLDNDKNLSYDLIINLNMIMSQKLIESDSGYIVDTQYMIFNDEITQTLLAIIDEGKHITREVNALVQDKSLQDMGLVKDWSYGKE